MFERKIHTEIVIAASPEKIWAALADLKTWSEWNKVVLGVDLKGPLQEGTKGRLSIRTPAGKTKLSVTLVTVRENEELAWQGGVSGLVTGCHGFRLEPTEGGTRLIHTEVFRGFFVPPLIGMVRKGMDKGYQQLNRGLKKHVESN
ncbi:MAG: SRPBCC domain-containing protein [Myxococcota bacterium]